MVSRGAVLSIPPHSFFLSTLSDPVSLPRIHSMIADKIQALAAFLLITGLTGQAAAASFNIQGISPVATVKGSAPPPLSAALTVIDAGGTQDWTASLEGNPAWASLSKTSGSGPGTLTISFSTASLDAGSYTSALALNSDGTVSRQTLTLTVITPYLVKMVPDPSRPWVYGLHSTTPDTGSFVLCIKTPTGEVGRVLPVGTRATDLAINHQEGRLYISNWGRNFIQSVDLQTQTVQSPLLSETDVHRLNAGRAGRLYSEGGNQWINAFILDSLTGSRLGDFMSFRQGDAEVDPTGRFYYHCDSDISTAYISKYDITGDKWSRVATSEPGGGYGSRNLVLSPDGKRLFWTGGVYDSDLKMLRNLGSEIYATSLHGELAVTGKNVLDAATGAVLASLPVTTTVSAIAGDQAALIYFDPGSKTVGAVPMATIAPIPVPGAEGQPSNHAARLSPVPVLTWDIVPSAFKYRVFFGKDASAVASATTTSPAVYAGETTNNFWNLAAEDVPPGGTFFWRVDAVGSSITIPGAVWEFKTLAATVSSTSVNAASPAEAPSQRTSLPVTGVPGTAWTASTSGAAWLKVLTVSGSVGDHLDLELTPGGLAAGIYTGSVTFSANGLSDTIPVSLVVQPLSLTVLKADPVRGRLYGIQNVASADDSLVVFDTGTGAITKVIPLSGDPTAMDLTPDNQFLYVVTRGGHKMHRIRLDDWTVSTKPLAASNDWDSTVVWYRVAAGAGTRVYWTDGEWAPRLHSMDFATGMETSPPILSSTTQAGDGFGFGSIARNGDGTRLVACSQYGWSAGISGANPVMVDVSGSTPVATIGGLSLPRDPLNAPVIIRSEGLPVFLKKYRMDPALTIPLKEYPAEVQAVTAAHGIVFGATAAWRENSLAQVWQAPANTDASICAVAGDQSAWFYFDKPAAKLIRLPMSTFGDVPGPLPEDGEVVSSMPSSLSWTPNPQAVRYEVYFGTDQAAVLDAAGPSSPLHLGTATEALLPLSQPFATAGLWWWRVDTVLPGSTIKGPVWKFGGALDYLTGIPADPDNASTYSLPALAMEGTTLMAGYSGTSFSSGGAVSVYGKVPGKEEWRMEQKIPRPATATAESQFGAAIAMRGEVAWIGAPADASGGRVYEYRREAVSRQWVATGRSAAPEATAPAVSYGASLAFDGSLLVVGAPDTAVDSYYSAGVVEILDAATLVRQARLSDSSPYYSLRYGVTMALGDGFLAVSSPARPAKQGSGSGAVDLWTRGDGGTWTRTTDFTLPTAANIPNFGVSLAVSGDILFAGTPSGSSDGAVYPWRRQIPGGTWTALPVIPRPGVTRQDSFNSVLAASGDALVMAAPSYSATETTLPRTWLLRRNGDQLWTPVAPAVPFPAGVTPLDGSRLALTGRYLAVAYGGQFASTPGVSVYLHNPDGNLPPLVSSNPVIFAEEGQSYQYPLTATDENPGDTLQFASLLNLPSWLGLKDAGGRRALLSGTPPAGSAGTISLEIAVTDASGASADQKFELRILPAGSIPRISADSGDQVADDGKQVTLSVTVPGAAATYQWFWNGVPLTGENRSTLVIGHAQASDAGEYQVRITRDGIWADSGTMRLTVNQVPDRFGGDWSTFGANNSHSGAYPATLGRHKFLPSWTAANAGPNQAVTGQGRVYTTGGGYFTQENTFTAYDLNTGGKLWSFPLPPSYSINPPSYRRGRVYMQRGKGTEDYPELICLDAANAALQWRSRFGAQWERYNAPVVTDDAVYIEGGDYGGIYGFGMNGVRLFFNSLEQVDGWAPMFHEGRLYSLVQGNFREHDPVSGQEIYKLGMFRDGPTGAMPAAEGNIAVMNSWTEIAAVNLETNTVAWRTAQAKDSLGFMGTPSIKNGTVYAISTKGVETFDARTGTRGRVYPIPVSPNVAGYLINQPIVLDDILICSFGDLICSFDLASGAPLQQFWSGGPDPLISYTDGVLLASDKNQTLHAWKVNQPATLTPATPVLAATEDLPVDWSLTVGDPDGDIPVIKAAGLPAWLKMSEPVQGVIHFTGTPRDPDHGAFAFTVSADDGQSFPTVLDVQGFVTAVNDPPSATSPAPLSLQEDQEPAFVELAAIFSDEEDEISALTVTVEDNTNPSLFSSVGISGEQLRLIPAPDAFGDSVILLRAMDSGGLKVETRLAVTVVAVNDPPDAMSIPPIVVDEDAALAPLPLRDLFHDVDNAFADLKFSITANTNPGLFRSLEVSDGSLLPALNPDANGNAMVTLSATDPGGLSATVEISLLVRPVNDPPVIPAVIPDVSAGASALKAVINFASYATDPDSGDVLTWRVVSITNPAIFSRLEFDSRNQLALDYAPYVSGQSTVTVEVADGSGSTARKSFTVGLPGLPSPVITASSTLTLNRQTGLQEQRITVKNVAERAIGGFEIAITGLPASASVYNASGGTAAAPVIGYYQPMAPGSTITLVIEYYTPARTTLQPVLAASAVLPREASSSAAGTISVDRAVMLEPGAFLLEFSAVHGELYQVQYKDGGGIWQDSLVRLRAGGNRVQWIDRGPPRTASPPGAGGSRFYRIRHLPPSP